jgi:flavodoxin
MARNLVVFYSRSGHTKKVAEAVAASLQCDLEELVDMKKRGGLFGFIKSGRDAMRKAESDIKKVQKNPGDYDIVILGTPIWGGNMAPAVRTYINRYRDQLKGVAFLCTSGSGDPQKSFSEMEEICGKAPVATVSVSAKDTDSGDFASAVETFTEGFGEVKRGTGTETSSER